MAAGAAAECGVDQRRIDNRHRLMTCTLSADLRVVGGAVAALLVAKFKELLENRLNFLL